MQNFIILSICLFLMSACYEKEEGCLDFKATNYNFGADKECDECCTYPTMKIGITHNWGDTTLLTDSIYFNLAGQPLRILNAQFYISEVAFIDQSDEVSILETIDIEYLNGSIDEFTAANAFVQTSRFTYTLGTFDKAEEYDGMTFKVGIDGQFYNDELVEDDSFFDTLSYSYTNFKMAYILDEVEKDTLTFEMTGPEYVRTIVLNANIDLPKGVNFTIPLAVDYQRLLNNVDLEFIDLDSEKAKVLVNFADAFSFN